MTNCKAQVDESKSTDQAISSAIRLRSFDKRHSILDNIDLTEGKCSISQPRDVNNEDLPP